MAWVEGYTEVKSIIKDIATVISQNGWTLEYPVNISSIEHKAVVSTTTSKGEKVYLQFERENPETNFNHMSCIMGTGYKKSADEWEPETYSEKARYAWYIEVESVVIKDWLPVQYWAQIENDVICMVLQGDPSASFEHFLVSPGYFGIIESYKDGDTDNRGNFFMSVGSDKKPPYSVSYGERTATGVTDFSAVKTRSGFPFQAHYPSFTTPYEFLERSYMGPSRWTHKYHLSYINLVHPYDRERGRLVNMLACDRSSIFHLDELIVNKGQADEEIYVFFSLKCPYMFFTNVANSLYAIAIKKV